MKRIITLLLTISMLFTLVGCTKSEANNDRSDFIDTLESNADLRWNICTEADTKYSEQSGDYIFFLMYSKEELGSNKIEEDLSKAFSQNAKDGSKVEDIVSKMLEADSENLNLISMPVEEGPLNGFTGEIKGFEEAAVFSPMIGSIPFIGYVFKLK